MNNFLNSSSEEFKKLLIIKDNIEKTLNIKQARKSFKFFADYVFGLKLGKLHIEWHNLATQAMQESQPCIIFAPRGHAKCFIPETLITLANKTKKQAKDCQIGEEVLALDTFTFQFVPAKIINIIDNGIKDVYKVKTETEKEIIVTKNHPFLTLKGWISIKDGLKEGDIVFTFNQETEKINQEQIIKIEYIGKQQTIGLTIDKYHNHITNDIITHNTTVMSVLRTLFLLGHNPDLRIKLVSHSDKKASDILRQIKEAIENNEKYHEVFPWVEPAEVWAANKILIKRKLWSKDVTIESLGVLSGATGGRCLTPDSLLITKHKLLPIEKITTQDLILSKNGKFNTILLKTKREYSGKIYYIKSRDYNEFHNSSYIGLTPEHLILIGIINKIEFNPYIKWISIEDLYQLINNIDNSKYDIKLLFPKYDNSYSFYAFDIDDIKIEDYSGEVYDLKIYQENSFCGYWMTLHNCDYIVFDDIVEFNNTIKYPALAKMVKEAFYNNWLNLLEAKNYGWCLIGTIWTQMDLHWELYQKPFKYKKLYRIDLETLEPIWPEYWTKEKLLERYNSMPLRAFARAFANLPISREDAVFSKDDIDKCIVYSDPKTYLKKCDYVLMGVDLAISKKKGSANTALFIMGIIKDKQNYKYVALHCEYGKWSSPETVNAILKNYKDWNVDVIIVEGNQYQEALKQWLEEFNQTLPVETHYTTAIKHDPEIGLPSMALEFKNRKWIIPMGKTPHDSECKCGKCKWIEELCMYPFGETSDLVMASYFAREYFRKNKRLNSDVIIETW